MLVVVIVRKVPGQGAYVGIWLAEQRGNARRKGALNQLTTED